MGIIYKYNLTHGLNELALPSDSTPLSVGVQNDEVVMWVLHARDPEMVRIYRRIFYVVNTGEPFSIGYSTFIGMAQIEHSGQYLTKHIFEQLDVS